MSGTEGFLTVAAALAWLVLALGRGRFWMAGPVLRSAGNGPSRWPAVCAVVPARNEADILPSTLPALLRQDYPGDLRVVLVDDESDDGTAGIAEGISSSVKSGRPFRVLRPGTREPGWTGKLWALEQGLRSYSAEYFLFTDADILHPPSSVRDLVALSEERGLDLASAMARLRCASFWERLLIPAFVFFFKKLYPFDWANDPRSRAAAAAGGAVLARRSALEKMGGLRTIRSEIIDDCALAKAVKRSGGNIWIGLSRDVRSLRAYPALGGVWNMVARTAFAQLGHSSLALAGTAAGMLLLYGWAPALFFAGIAGGDPVRTALGAGLWTAVSLLYSPMVRFYGLSPLRALSLPFAACLYCGMTFHSAWLYWTGSGGLWKGRAQDFS